MDRGRARARARVAATGRGRARGAVSAPAGARRRTDTASSRAGARGPDGGASDSDTARGAPPSPRGRFSTHPLEFTDSNYDLCSELGIGNIKFARGLDLEEETEMYMRPRDLVPGLNLRRGPPNREASRDPARMAPSNVDGDNADHSDRHAEAPDSAPCNTPGDSSENQD